MTDAPMTMPPNEWLGALADAWEQGHEVCEHSGCLTRHGNPYRVASPDPICPERGIPQSDCAPYYQDDAVTLYHGDCREVAAWIEADVLVTDPPYGIGWSKGAMKHAHNGEANVGIQNDADTSARDAALRMWGARPALVFGSLRAAFPDGWLRMLVFKKPTIATGITGHRIPWRNNWEPVFVCGAGWPDALPTHDAVIPTRALTAGGYSGYATAAGHPHAKPIDVLQTLMLACPPGIIADPFAGSGSTLVAAKQLGRRAVGVELDERFCEIAARRLSQDVLDFGDAAS